MTLAPEITELQPNVYYLDHDPDVAARSHCDAHLFRGLATAVQLLSTAWHMCNPELLDTSIGCTDRTFTNTDFARQKAAGLPFGVAHYIGNQRIYGLLHEHLPLAEWARECTGNYDWLYRLGSALCDELAHRYGRSSLAQHILRTLEQPPPSCAGGPANEPPPTMSEEYVVEADGYVDAVASYRNYYREGKRHMLKYTKRMPPKWCADLVIVPA